MVRVRLHLEFLRHIKDELPVTLGTASTEAVLPQMLVKLEKLGIPKPVVGLVLPTGYALNADGTAIHLAMAAICIAQAMPIDLALWEQLLLGMLLFTAKGSAGPAGAGFVARWEGALDLQRARGAARHRTGQGGSNSARTLAASSSSANGLASSWTSWPSTPLVTRMLRL